MLDPQGLAIAKSLDNLGIRGINEVKQGKYFELDIDSGENVEEKIKKACEGLLANTVIENYRYELVG